MNSYGGGGDCTGTAATIRPQPEPAARHPTAASTYTPEEARMAEQYAHDAMADANWPSEDNAHRVWRT